MTLIQANTVNVRSDSDTSLQDLTFAAKYYISPRKYFQSYEGQEISNSPNFDTFKALEKVLIKLEQNNVNKITRLPSAESTRHILSPYVERFSTLLTQIKYADKPEVVIDSLRRDERNDIANQLTGLYEMADEEGEDIVLQSLQQFALFMMREQQSTLNTRINSTGFFIRALPTEIYNTTSFTIYNHPSTPEIGINPDGFIQAIWKVPNYGNLVMDFLPSNDVVFSILFNQDTLGGQQRRVSGVVPQHDIMRYVGEFTDMHPVGIQHRNISESFWQSMWADEPQSDSIINKLSDNGHHDIVEQLTDLYKMADEDGEEIMLQSLWQFALFMMRSQQPIPEIGINPDGFIQAIWKVPNYGNLVMDFLPSNDVVFSILFNQDTLGGQQRRVSGVVSQHDIMRYMGDFTKRLIV